MARKNRSPEETERRAKIRELQQLANVSSMDDMRAKIRELQQLANVSSMDDIQNQQLLLGQRPFQLAHMVVILCFTQFRRKCCRILKQDIVSQGAGFQAQSNRQMSLAQAGVANHKD